MDDILNRIVELAKKNSSVKALILSGSRAAGLEDELSDYDLALFCTSYDSFVKDENWLSDIGKVWVCVHEKVEYSNKTFPTRLVIFENGIKADFSFYTLDVLQDLVRDKSLPDAYSVGYTVLVDKESLTTSMAKATHKERKADKPVQEEFLRVINEFWFEVYHVAKYLKRQDLWSVKFRMSGIYDMFFLKMIEWNEEAKRNWISKVPPEGKRMASWVDKETWKELYHIFAHFESHDSKQALMHMSELFRKLALDTAKRLGYDYPHELDKNITHFTNSILKQSDDR